MNDDPKSVERVRPFLQAMDASIADARKRRLHRQTTPRPVTPAPTPTPTDATVDPESSPPQRLRARPKRPTGVMPGYDETRFRSKAG